ncbi:hypothetical protein D3C73_554060 [compost metagenome]
MESNNPWLWMKGFKQCKMLIFSDDDKGILRYLRMPGKVEGHPLFTTCLNVRLSDSLLGVRHIVLATASAPELNRNLSSG